MNPSKSRPYSIATSGSWTWTSKTLFVTLAILSLFHQDVNTSPIDGEGMVPEFMAGLNSVPRMGRRSLSPFMRTSTGGTGVPNTNSGSFRFISSRPRRRVGPYNPFGGGFPAFRFVGGPGAYQGAFRVKRMKEMAPDVFLGVPGYKVDNVSHPSKRVLPPVHVGTSMFPSVRQQQNQYWQGLLNEAARESLLQRLSGVKYDDSEKPSSGEIGGGNGGNIAGIRSPLARFLSRYQGGHEQQ